MLAVSFLCGITRAGYRPLDHMWWGVRDLPNTTSLVVLGAGLALTLGSLSYDDRVRDYFADQDRLGGWEAIGNFWGTGIPGGLIALGSIGWGVWKDRPYELESGEAHGEALAANALMTGLIKISVYRWRPDGGSHTAFPSGHTSTAFVTAANLMHRYGPAFGVPAIAMGVWTAVSRLAINVHWLSDTFFGAALGYAVGYAYTLHHAGAQSAPSTVVIPYYGSREDFGLNVAVRW